MAVRRAACRCLAVLIVTVVYSLPAARAETDSKACSDILQDFFTFTSANEAAPYTGSNSIITPLLHIPRTAGGTLNCLLRAAVAPQDRCPSGYKTLPDRQTLSNCAFVASHDDFSAMQQLPAGTAVVSELRDPVDRILSSYEFAIERAARNINKTKQQAAPIGLFDALDMTLTDDVWPWNHLVSFFEQDISPKVGAVCVGGEWVG